MNYTTGTDPLYTQVLEGLKILVQWVNITRYNAFYFIFTPMKTEGKWLPETLCFNYLKIDDGWSIKQEIVSG
jgi:hypothetical protein